MTIDFSMESNEIYLHDYVMILLLISDMKVVFNHVMIDHWIFSNKSPGKSSTHFFPVISVRTGTRTHGAVHASSKL